MALYSALLVFIASYMQSVGTSIVQGATVHIVLQEPGFAAAIVTGEFRFNCTAEGSSEPVQSFHWYHNGSLIDPLSNFRISTSMNSERPWSETLMVSSAVRADAGEYYCVAAFADTNITSNPYLLRINGIFSLHVDAEFETILHSKIEVKCIVDAVPTPRLTWSRLNATNDVTNIVLKQEPGNPKHGTLEKNVTIEDDGKWRCAANTFFGGKESDFIITVIVPPVNTSISLLTNQTVQKNTDFELLCSSDNKHSPTFAWTHNGVNNITNLALSLDSRYKINSELGRLTVKGATYGDSGVYTCTATNRAGSDSADFIIDVEGAPEILIHDYPPPIRMSKVTGGYLNCPFISNPPPTNVQWMKGSSPVQSGEEYQIFSHNGTLFISSLESAESELVSFTCYIANKYGSDNRTFNMHLIDIPEAPANFTIMSCDSDDHSIELSWIASRDTVNSSDEVEDYVLEQSLNGDTFQLSKEIFDKNATSGTLSGLLSGVNYTFRLRARNLAGLSKPSNSQTCSIQDFSPGDDVSVCDCGYDEYYIFAGIAGGVLLITIIIIVIISCLACHKQHSKRRKTIQCNVDIGSEEKTKEEQLFKIISNTSSNLQMYTV